MRFHSKPTDPVTPVHSGCATREGSRAGAGCGSNLEVRPGPRPQTLRPHQVKTTEVGPEALPTVSLPITNGVVIVSAVRMPASRLPGSARPDRGGGGHFPGSGECRSVRPAGVRVVRWGVRDLDDRLSDVVAAQHAEECPDRSE